MLVAQQRLELAALAQEDLAGLSTRYVADELALLWQRSPRQARNRLELAQLFAAFPVVHALVADGTWLIDHADAALTELGRTRLDHGQQQQVLDLVLSRPGRRTPWELRAAVRTAVLVLFPELAADEAERALADRDVRCHADAPGAATLVANGPAPLVAAMMACLDTVATPAAPADARTTAQRRFDALLDLVCGRIQPDNWQVHLLVALTTVEGQDELPGELPGLGPVPAAQAREIAAAAALRRVVVDEQTGRLLAVDDRVHRPDLAPPAPDLLPLEPPDEPDDDPDDPDNGWPHGGPQDAPDEGPPGPPHPGGPAAASQQAPPARPTYLAPRWSPQALTGVLQRTRSEPVRVLDLSSDRYQVPKRLRRFLELRDRTCVFPGCPRPALRCDKDHLLPWPRGSTSEPNLADECEHHHQGKHDCLTVHRLPDGTFRWTTPGGITADRPPRPVLDSWTYRSATPPPARSGGSAVAGWDDDESEQEGSMTA